MTPEWIERFKIILDAREKDRLKVIHDRKAYLFMSALVSVLALCCLVAGGVGSSSLVFIFGLILMSSGLVLFGLRSTLARAYRQVFRETLTRAWFQAAYPGIFLAPAPLSPQVPIEVSRSLREACIRATAQNPSLTVIEERIFFDTDSYHSWAFILVERSRLLGRIRSRALVWFRAAAEESAFVAFAWPPLGLAKAPDVRFFMKGQAVESSEPLRSKLVAVYERLRMKASGQEVRVSLSPTGIWAGVKLKGPVFEAPLRSSVFDLKSYASWAQEAELLVDREVAGLLATI